MRRAGLAILNNAGRAIALITLFVASLVTFTDLSFQGFATKSFTATVMIMLIASYLIYFSMEDTGEKAAEGSADYRSAMERYSLLRDAVRGDELPALRKFCSEYSQEELRYRRESLLISHGESLDSFAEYLGDGKNITRKRKRIFAKARRLRSVELSPKILLSREHTRTKSELTSPDTYKLLHLLVKLIPTTLCMILTVSIIPSVKENLTASLVIEGILKLSSLPIIAFRGYSTGFFHIRRRMIPWIETKARLLSAFKEENKKEKPASAKM